MDTCTLSLDKLRGPEVEAEGRDEHHCEPVNSCGRQLEFSKVGYFDTGSILVYITYLCTLGLYAVGTHTLF